MRDEHVKEAAEDVAEDVAQDLAEDVLAPWRMDRHLSAAERSSQHLWLHLTAPTPPKVSSSTVFSSSRQALFERLKPFVGAAGPVAVAVDS